MKEKINRREKARKREIWKKRKKVIGMITMKREKR